MVVGITQLWSPIEATIWVWGSSLGDVPRARGDEWQGEETISTNLSTDVLSGLSSEGRPGKDRLLSSVVYISSGVLEAEGSTVSAM